MLQPDSIPPLKCVSGADFLRDPHITAGAPVPNCRATAGVRQRDCRESAGKNLGESDHHSRSDRRRRPRHSDRQGRLRGCRRLGFASKSRITHPTRVSTPCVHTRPAKPCCGKGTWHASRSAAAPQSCPSALGAKPDEGGIRAFHQAIVRTIQV